MKAEYVYSSEGFKKRRVRLNDSRIIKLFIKRSESAIAELNKKYRPYMYSISRNIVNNNEDAEDCLNDSYMKIWESIPPIIPKSLSAYTGRVIRNISLDRYRMMNSQKRSSGEFTLVLDEMAEMIADNHNVENAVVNKEVIEVINQYLATITKEKRMIFVMRYYHSYSINGIGEQLNISISKVKMTLMRLRVEIKDCLSEKGIKP